MQRSNKDRGINFCVANHVWRQEINWWGHEIVGTKTIPDFFAPMIEGVAGNLREAQGLVDSVDKSVAGIVLAKPVPWGVAQ